MRRRFAQSRRVRLSRASGVLLRRVKHDNADSLGDFGRFMSNDVAFKNHLDRTVNRVAGTESVLLIRPF